MAVHRKADTIIVVAIAICVAAYACIRPKFRLRPAMPVEFFDASRFPAEKRASEEKIAKAYWKCAVTEVQWKYGYAHRLPDEPPAEFSIPAAEIGPAANDLVIRARYWQRLREAWGISSVWNEHYEWDPISLTGSLQSAGEWLERQMRRLMGYS